MIGIRTPEVMEGRLPRRALELVRVRAESHQEELMRDGKLRLRQQALPVAPLE